MQSYIVGCPYSMYVYAVTNSNFMKRILIVAAIVGIAATVLIAYSIEATAANELKAPLF
jgi:hypothetical protein